MSTCFESTVDVQLFKVFKHHCTVASCCVNRRSCPFSFVRAQTRKSPAKADHCRALLSVGVPFRERHCARVYCEELSSFVSGLASCVDELFRLSSLHVWSESSVCHPARLCNIYNSNRMTILNTFCRKKDVFL